MSKSFFYSTFSCDPYFNMAMDEWMFSRVHSGGIQALMRLYTWKCGCITLGLNQKLELAVNQSLLGDTPLIRRITGGRALYHEPTELTYSIAVNLENISSSKLSSSIQESGRYIARGMVEFLSEIGISAQYVRQSSAGFGRSDSFHTKHCFQSKARNEVICGERKIVASAQRRIGSSFLQHGSIKIKEPKVHPALSPEASKLVDDSVIVELGQLEFAGYSEIFRNAMASELELDCQSMELTESEECEVRLRSENLRKFAIQKRDLFKQFPHPVSL